MTRKKIKTIILVEPTCGHDKKHAQGGHNEFEPLGLQYISAVLRKHGYDVHILRQMSCDTDDFVRTISGFAPGAVCFTVLTYNSPEALDIAGRLKANNDNIIIVFGGYHPSSAPADVLEKGDVDFVVIGEGEETIIELFDAIERQDKLHHVSGIAFLENTKFIKTPPRRRMRLLDSLPFPTRKAHLLKDCRIYGLMYPPPSKQINTATVACSRGCNFSCEFCCSKAVWGEGVTYRSPDNVMREIAAIQTEYGSNTIFFSDLTFNSSKRWVKELCDKIIESGLTFNWYCMCTILGMDEELIILMSKAGCRKIGFGIETLDSNIAVKSFKNPCIENLNEIFDLCSRHGIFTKAYLMIGTPYETREALEDFKTRLHMMRVDEIKISFYTPFPGTCSFEKYKHNLSYRDYSYFDTLSHVVIRNDNIAEEEYLAIRKNLSNAFYKEKSYQARIKANLEKNLLLMDSYAEFFEFLQYGNDFLSNMAKNSSLQYGGNMEKNGRIACSNSLY